eukprot:TRINITY_DN1943_c0_g1_i1.p1 TRINITY_DN1943_c0_g1~~TRINITY_DN1943_c0_g1_i1.p1  ORF type:complete len:241 (+),score=54.92 TRINITY_DN1943_c0_g1_i1:275-997(+)
MKDHEPAINSITSSQFDSTTDLQSEEYKRSVVSETFDEARRSSVPNQTELENMEAIQLAQEKDTPGLWSRIKTPAGPSTQAVNSKVAQLSESLDGPHFMKDDLSWGGSDETELKNMEAIQEAQNLDTPGLWSKMKTPDGRDIKSGDTEFRNMEAVQIAQEKDTPGLWSKIKTPGDDVGRLIGPTEFQNMEAVQIAQELDTPGMWGPRIETPGDNIDAMESESWVPSTLVSHKQAMREALK